MHKGFILGLLSTSLSSPAVGPLYAFASEVDLLRHVHVVDAPAGFITFPLLPAARLLIVPLSLNVLCE